MIVKNYRKIMYMVKDSEIMQSQWNSYQKDFEYAKDITFEDACDVVVGLMDKLIVEDKLGESSPSKT